MKKRKLGEVVPYGFSVEDTLFPYTFFKIPLPFIRKRKWYNVELDKEVHGWVRKDLLFKFMLKTGDVPVGKQVDV